MTSRKRFCPRNTQGIGAQPDATDHLRRVRIGVSAPYSTNTGEPGSELWVSARSWSRLAGGASTRRGFLRLMFHHSQSAGPGSSGSPPSSLPWTSGPLRDPDEKTRPSASGCRLRSGSSLASPSVMSLGPRRVPDASLSTATHLGLNSTHQGAGTLGLHRTGLRV